MGCAGSRHQLITSGAHQGSCSIKAEGDQLYTCEYAGRTLPRKGKNQDRFGMRFAGGALTVGIFDGHSVHDAASGIRHAEEACTHLTNGLYPQASPASACPGQPASAAPELTARATVRSARVLSARPRARTSVQTCPARWWSAFTATRSRRRSTTSRRGSTPGT